MGLVTLISTPVKLEPAGLSCGGAAGPSAVARGLDRTGILALCASAEAADG